ncbi:MAG: ABC transporter permease [Pirellulaceae bacterium]
MVLWKMAWREMQRHPGRALLTLLSVIIGVAAVLAVGLSTGSAQRAYHEMFQTITGRAALEITAAGGATLDGSLLDVVRHAPGVAAAVPLVQRNAIMHYSGGRMKLQALGIDPTLDAAVRDYDLVEGQTLSKNAGVLLDAALAHNLGIQVGDEVRLLVRRGLVTTNVVGLVKPRSGSAVGGGGVLFMPLATAQRRFAAVGKLDRIQVVLTEGADLLAVQSQLIQLLPTGVQVQPPTTRSSLAEETMLALENGLRLATAFSLLAALFIIMNTFLMNVGQRRRQLAVMRAIGATRRQISGLLAREAMLLALFGTSLGIVVGLAGATLLNRTLGGLFQTALPSIELRPLPLAIAIAFGLGVSLLGAVVPARRAARVTPQEGMSGIASGELEGHSRRGVLVGLAITLTAAVLLAACLVGWLPFEASVAVTVLALIGLVLLLPFVLRPLTYLGEFVLRPVAGIEARLARRQLLRHYGRTTLTIGVLFVAVSTGLGLANSVVDNVADVRHWYRAAIVGDFFVRAAMPDMEIGLSAAVPESVGADIQGIRGVTRVDSVRIVSAKVDGQSAFVVALRNEFLSPAETQQGDSPLLESLPQDDRVTIGSVLAQRTGLHAGDSITLDTRDGPRQLPISAIANEYAAGGLTVRMNRALAERLLSIEGVDAYIVKAEHTSLRQVEDSLREVCAKQGMLLQSYADLTAIIEGMMSGVVGSLWGLLVLGLIVAAFGVVNTLGMNVLEQTRELGLLRVVAMTRGQVRKTIMAQAAMLGLLGVVPGLLAGLAMAYVMNLSTLPVTGHPVAFTLHPLLLFGGFLAAMTIVLTAAWIPAERAARLELASALHYE